MIRVRLREAMHRHERATGERVTYASLAKETGLSRATLEAIGSREDYLPSLRAIDQICEALECELSDLLERAPTRSSKKTRS